MAVNDGHLHPCMLTADDPGSLGRALLGGASALRPVASPERPMIKDVMVRLDGTAADDLRLAAVGATAEHFESHVIGLFLNVLPMLVPAEWDGISAVHAADIVAQARAA
jgi:hypothetical protein